VHELYQRVLLNLRTFTRITVARVRDTVHRLRRGRS
jgi:hypothetical protein